MKFLFSLLLLTFFLTASTTLTAQAEDPAVLAVKKAVTTFFDYDNEAYANAYAEHGAMVNPFGRLMVSPTEIFNSHVPLFSTYWKGVISKATFLSASSRYLEDDIAIVHLKIELLQSKSGEENDRSIAQASAVVRRTAEGWKMELFHVTPVQPVPGE